MKAIDKFIETHNISFLKGYPKRIDRNPNMPDHTEADHWHIRIRVPEVYRSGEKGGLIDVPFSMGWGLNGKSPKVRDILDCLASDAASIANASGFEDWANELGYSDDSIKALAIYKTCKDQAAELLEVLSPKRYEELLFSIERL